MRYFVIVIIALVFLIKCSPKNTENKKRLHFDQEITIKDINIKNGSAKLLQKIIIPWKNFESEYYRFQYESSYDIEEYGGVMYNVPSFVGIDNNKAVFFVDSQVPVKFVKGRPKYKIYFYSIDINNIEIKKSYELKFKKNPNDKGSYLGLVLTIDNKGNNFYINHHLNAKNVSDTIDILNSNFEIIKRISLNSEKLLKYNDFVLFNNWFCFPDKSLFINNKNIESSDMIIFPNVEKKLNSYYKVYFPHHQKLITIWKENYEAKVEYITVYDHNDKTHIKYSVSKLNSFNIHGMYNNYIIFTKAPGIRLKSIYNDKFNNNQLYLYDLKKKIGYMINHKAYSLDINKKDEFMYNDYQVNKDGTIWCIYMHRKGIYLYKMKLDL